MIICGDAVQILAGFPADLVDLTVTSPPYDDLRTYHGYHFDFEGMASELYRVTKDGGVVVWIVGDKVKDGDESGTSFRQALYFKEIGFNLFDTMIYAKVPRGAVGSSNHGYFQGFEYMFVLSKGIPKSRNLIYDRKNKRAGMHAHKHFRDVNGKQTYHGNIEVKPYGRRTNIWEYLTGAHSATDDVAYGHPAIFPEKLVSDHIQSWSNAGDFVLDPMMGSGTTLKMAKLLKREYIGIDISEQYCQLAQKRLNPAQTELPF